MSKRTSQPAYTATTIMEIVHDALSLRLRTAHLTSYGRTRIRPRSITTVPSSLVVWNRAVSLPSVARSRPSATRPAIPDG